MSYSVCWPSTDWSINLQPQEDLKPVGRTIINIYLTIKKLSLISSKKFHWRPYTHACTHAHTYTKQNKKGAEREEKLYTYTGLRLFLQKSADPDLPRGNEFFLN